MGTKAANIVATVARGRGSLRGFINRLGLSRTDAGEGRFLDAPDHPSRGEAWWRDEDAGQEPVVDRYEWQGQGELFHSVGRTHSSFHGPSESSARSLCTTRISVDRKDAEVVSRKSVDLGPAVRPRPHITAAKGRVPAGVSLRQGTDTGQVARFLTASGVVDGLFVEPFRFALMGKRMGERLRLWGGASHSTDV